MHICDSELSKSSHFAIIINMKSLKLIPFCFDSSSPEWPFKDAKGFSFVFVAVIGFELAPAISLKIIIKSSSPNVSFSLFSSLLRAFCKVSKVIISLSFSAPKNLKAAISSSSCYVSFICSLIKAKNSSSSISPPPS